MSRRKPDDPSQMLLFGQMVRVDSDTFKLVVSKPAKWVTVAEAARIMGVSETTVRDLMNNTTCLLWDQPSRRRRRVDLQSIHDHLAATRDPEFWALKKT